MHKQYIKLLLFDSVEIKQCGESLPGMGTCKTFENMYINSNAYERMRKTHRKTVTVEAQAFTGRQQELDLTY